MTKKWNIAAGVTIWLVVTFLVLFVIYLFLWSDTLLWFPMSSSYVWSWWRLDIFYEIIYMINNKEFAIMPVFIFLFFVLTLTSGIVMAMELDRTNNYPNK